MKGRLGLVGRTHAIVPLNVLSKSKARLSPILRPSEREQLSIAMLKDVLSALKKARQIQAVTVVSADRSVCQICRRSGVSFLWEGKRRGLNKGVRLAVGTCERRGVSSALVIHSDLPLLKTEEIDLFLKRSQGYSVALAPSKNRDGTNALLMTPPTVIRPAFGKDSFRRHLRIAKQKNARSRVLLFRGFSFDVDTPRDLLHLLRMPLRNETGRFLRAYRKHSK